MSTLPKKPPQSTPDCVPLFRDFALPSSKEASTGIAPNSPAIAVSPEPYVDAQCVAEHLSLTRREVLKLTRAGKLPSHAIDPSAVRKIYRYKLSEIDTVLSPRLTPEQTLGFSTLPRDNDHRQP